VGKYFGVEAGKIKEAIENYFPTNNRSQKIKVGSNTVILDAYNANPSSMIEALRNFEKMEADNKLVILGEMMELGDYSQSEHEKIKQQVAEMPLAKKVFTGKGFSFLKNHPSFLYFDTTDELKKWFRGQQFENSYILIKGSRKNELEKILKN
jgi:UDP-N-acetylmuramoyl-tripeptide--D-alanyl-D-alanine ligase